MLEKLHYEGLSHHIIRPTEKLHHQLPAIGKPTGDIAANKQSWQPSSKSKGLITGGANDVRLRD